MIDVTLLGCGGMLPMKNRWLTSCLVSYDGSSVLIDCGEGTQIALKCAARRVKPIEMICITHFHADHISGLPGLLLSIGNEGRTEPLTITGPKGIEKVVKSLCIIAPNLPFELRFAENNEFAQYMMKDLIIKPFKVRHTVDCYGYTIELSRQGKFDPQKAVKNNVPKCIWSKLQKENECLYEDRLYTFDMVGGEKRKGLKISYCTDTRPVQNIVSYVDGSDLFICEGLYYDPEKRSRALKSGHMLFCEAARLSYDAKVSKLWLTHFSPALTDPEEGLTLAREIFPETECGFDGKSITLDFDD